jgi:hypothetical protein
MYPCYVSRGVSKRVLYYYLSAIFLKIIQVQIFLFIKDDKIVIVKIIKFIKRNYNIKSKAF